MLCDLRPQQPRFQAPRRAPRKLAQELRTPANGRTPALLMPARIPKIEAAAASPFPINPIQNVPARVASRADEPLPHAAAERHRPFPQTHPDLGSARLDQDALGAPADPRERHTGWVLPRHLDAFAKGGEGFDGEARGMAEQAAIWARYSACSDGSDHSGEILLASLSEARGGRGWKGRGGRSERVELDPYGGVAWGHRGCHRAWHRGQLGYYLCDLFSL